MLATFGPLRVHGHAGRYGQGVGYKSLMIAFLVAGGVFTFLALRIRVIFMRFPSCHVILSLSLSLIITFSYGKSHPHHTPTEERLDRTIRIQRIEPHYHCTHHCYLCRHPAGASAAADCLLSHAGILPPSFRLNFTIRHRSEA